MDQKYFDFALEHVRARAVKHERDRESFDAEKKKLQSVLDNLQRSAPGLSNQSEKKSEINREINAKKVERDDAHGRQIAAMELEKILADVTDIDEMPALVHAFAKVTFPADSYPTGSADVLIAYFDELSDLAKTLTNSRR